MTQSATVKILESIDKPGSFRQVLKMMVEQERPEAVMVVYQSEVIINYGGVNPVAKSSRSPREKMIIRIEASSPVANYELVLVYRKQKDRYVFEHPAERGGCEHTRDLWGSVN